MAHAGGDSVGGVVESRIEALLGISIPDGATISPTTGGGFVATAIDHQGTQRTIEVAKNGQYFRSVNCRGDTREGRKPVQDSDGHTEWVPACRDFSRVPQRAAGHHLDPKKVEQVRALLLKDAKSKTPIQ